MNPEPITILTIKEVNELLCGLFASFFEWPAYRVLIETKADARPPDGPYMTIWWKSNDPLPQGYGEFIQPDLDDDGNVITEGKQLLDNESYCTLQLTIRGKDAYSLCNEARYFLESSQRFFDLWQILGFSGCGPVTDMSANFGGQIQQRAFFDFNFYANFGREYPADWFDHSKWIINNTEKIM